MRSIRKIIFSLLVIVLIFSAVGQALALDNNYQSISLGDIGVQWTNTSSIDINLSFEGSKAICGAIVIGKVGVNEIRAKVTLERKNSDGTYTVVKTWDNLYSDKSYLIFDKIYYVSTGYTYRLAITATVYRDGYGETVYGDFEAHCY